MRFSSARITSKGKITLPVEIREHLGIAPGDCVDFHRGRGGEIVLVARAHRLQDMKGMLPHDGPPLSDEEIVAITAGARKDLAARNAPPTNEADE